MRILLTGATGFVGQGILGVLKGSSQYDLVAALRVPSSLVEGVPYVIVKEGLDADTDWNRALRGVEVVIHSAARVHIMSDDTADPLSEYRRINVDGTLNLARQAAKMGVKRFVFLSSIKVNGEGEEIGHPYTADSIPAPLDPYGISKYEAEQGLWEIAKKTAMEVVIIRPVLVYGPGVKANFRSMMSCLKKGIPLPLGGINNLRSMVALDNLVDLIVTCISHPSAKNSVFLVSDDCDVSTSELLRRMAVALGIPPRFFSVPSCILNVVTQLLGRQDIYHRLYGSLQVDISLTKQKLGWSPSVCMDDALRKTAEHFILEGEKRH